MTNNQQIMLIYLFLKNKIQQPQFQYIDYT
jgi:hypothetical protein